MTRWYVFLLILASLNAAADEVVFCPPGTTEIEGKRVYQRQFVNVRGCVNSEGLLHGPTLLLDGGIVIEQCEYLNGVEDGACIRWYSTGQKQRSMEFKGGKLHGEVRSWYPNGKLAIHAIFDEGRAVGAWREWDESGNLLS